MVLLYKWMVTIGTRIVIADNTGARLGSCIKVLEKGNQMAPAQVGDKIVIAIKRAVPTKKKLRIKEHDVRVGILVRRTVAIRRPEGLIVSFVDNAAILIDARLNPLGTRIIGPVPHELRLRKRMRILLLARCVV